MSRIKTGGRGFEFSRREIEIAWADTKAELDEEDRSRRDNAEREDNQSGKIHSECR